MEEHRGPSRNRRTQMQADGPLLVPIKNECLLVSSRPGGHYRRMDLPGLLHRVLPAVLRAGEMIRDEFFRPDGPRGTGHKAPVDTEIEIFLRDELRAVLPVSFVGEETPPVLEGDPASCWLVDPHDGTSEFLRGALGSSVSVALMRDGVPVLGAVHAPLSPDLGSDLIGWAEGMDHVIRNGAPVRPDLSARGLGPEEVVLLAYRSYARPATNLRRVAPARFMSSNSIAYRLARVAAGDAVATASRQSKLSAYDYAGGHALLRGAGAAFVDGNGRPPVYGPNGTGGMDKCFAGAPRAVQALLGNDWSMGSPPETPLPERITLGWPRSDRGLDRAIGCLAGLVLGEGKVPGRLPGQCGPAAEAAIALARRLIDHEPVPSQPGGPGLDEPWLWCTPLAIGAGPGEAARLAMDAAAQASAAPGSIAACASYAAAIAAGVDGGDHAAMVQAAFDAARALPDAAAVVRALQAARDGQPGDGGFPLGMLQRGFFHLGRRTELQHVLGESGVAGALLGAVGGRAALPRNPFLSVLACRPLVSAGALEPRPPTYWADDLPLVAEALLRAR